MHEGTVCREILDIAIEAAHNNDISKITAITMVKGINSCIHDDELQFYFDVARKGTIAEEAILIIQIEESLTEYHSEYVKNIEGD